MATGTTLPGSAGATAIQSTSLSTAGAASRAPARPSAPPERLRRPAPSAPRTWSQVLERVREVTRASAVLAMDADGLVIGSAGALTIEEGDELAAHIGRAFDLLNGLRKLGGKAESVCALYSPEGTWLTATRFSAPSGTRVTIGIVGPYTLIRADRMHIRNAFFRLFEADELDVPTTPAPEGDPS